MRANALGYSNYIPKDMGDSGKQESSFLFSKLCFFIFQFGIGFPDKVRCVYPECIYINWIKLIVVSLANQITFINLDDNFEALVKGFLSRILEAKNLANFIVKI